MTAIANCICNRQSQSRGNSEVEFEEHGKLQRGAEKIDPAENTILKMRREG